ncbi:thiamine pyrophosphate-binding protein [Saccharopolyspora hattusasensis]|uniref:thiamine pyrophosphate-binding protein n=1 Tax=Saccharopolyspora hattusasensis TaxID=1128679 RepID=UPI003D989D33
MTHRPDTTDSAPTGAHLLVDSLIGHGIDTIFGVPGDTGVNLYDVLASRKDRIRHVLARDERDSGYMADGFARTGRRLAVCEASSGAGAVYLASGLAEAFASSIPVLAITTDIHRSSRGSGAITEIDQVKLFSAVTKWQKVAERAEDIPALVAEAVGAALGGRPAPVVLICPEDVLDEHADVEPSRGRCVVPTDTPAAPAETLTQAAEVLRRAQSPVILAGGGVHASGAWDELRLFAEHLGAPVATTIHGKSSFPENHALSLGVAGGNGSRGYANPRLAEADAVLIVGSRSNSTDTNGFTAPPQNGPAVVQIDIDESRAGRNFPGGIGLVGDAATVLRQLREILPSASEGTVRNRTVEIAAARHQWDEETSVPLLPTEDGSLQPREIVRTLHRALGPDCWVAADPGTPTPNLSAFWETDGTAWRVVIPRGHGPMGYSISAAIGISLAHPGDRVLCLTTEGSLAMGVADWETAGRLRLPITYVVLDNSSFAWIKMLQHLFMQRRYFQVDPGPINPVLLAQGMGLPASLAGDLDELELLVKQSAATEGPSVIHVRVPEHKDSPPPVAPWQTALANPAASRPVY